MTYRNPQAEAHALLLRALNILLKANRADYRVTGDVAMTRKNGYTVIAFEETHDAADWATCEAPIDRQHLRRQ